MKILDISGGQLASEGYEANGFALESEWGHTLNRDTSLQGIGVRRIKQVAHVPKLMHRALVEQGENIWILFDFSVLVCFGHFWFFLASPGPGRVLKRLISSFSTHIDQI